MEGLSDNKNILLQGRLDAITTFLQSTVLIPSPERTAYTVVANKKLGKENIKDFFETYMAGVKLQHKKRLTILVLPIDEDVGAETNMQTIVKTWRHTLNIIRRVTSKSR